MHYSWFHCKYKQAWVVIQLLAEIVNLLKSFRA